MKNSAYMPLILVLWFTTARAQNGFILMQENFRGSVTVGSANFDPSGTEELKELKIPLTPPINSSIKKALLLIGGFNNDILPYDLSINNTPHTM